MNEEIRLQPLRRKIFRHSFQLVGLYILVGLFMMLAVYLSGATSPRIIHLNYDSIADAQKMSEAWNALRHPQSYPEKSPKEWAGQFESAIRAEEYNITEPGENEVAKDIRQLWNRAKPAPSALTNPDFSHMRKDIDQLIRLNENGMFAQESSGASLSRKILIISSLIFLFTIFIAIYLADGLAMRIAQPLKDLAETLRRKPLPGSKLKLPEATSLETRVLTHEMGRLWDRLSALRKLNLEELSVQGKRLETVLASVDDAILVLDNEGKVLQCNEGMLRLLGLSSEEVRLQPWEDLPGLSENYLKLRGLLVPEISSDSIVELVADGKGRYYSGRRRAILGKDSQPIGTLYLLHDITESRQKDRLKTEFLGVLSHELKTPLQSLSTASELLMAKKGSLDEDGKMLVDTLHEDVGRIRAVANEFVQVGLVDLHSLRLKMDKIDVAEVLPQWIKPFQVLAKDRKIQLQLVKEGSAHIFARMDTVKFPWAISNLLSNAIRVSPADSSITVRLTDREGRVDIEIQDEGPGISPETQARMFEPYFQGAKYMEKSTGFLGLGLTIAKEVVEAHEGSIEYFPRKPHGSIFRLSLPLQIGTL